MFVTLWLKAEFRSQSKSGDMFRSARSAYVCTGVGRFADGSGSATPMRGKSATCRKAFLGSSGL
jgi:hypothetical protein